MVNTLQGSENNLKPKKKVYQKPRLIAYGDIREITKVTGGTLGMNDGGSGKDKTG